ncbi:hypothetical protein CEXT_706621 [Caerostris extrusa]|uniref:Uncharacterized protein n=1 Tax=Caerostris extrusa TaxID=172846 RepID=A0AAV4RI74_CAEEX|nr:hypothetical protein CEXT_706621 [Caerostris extrusa]
MEHHRDSKNYYSLIRYSFSRRYSISFPAELRITVLWTSFVNSDGQCFYIIFMLPFTSPSIPVSHSSILSSFLSPNITNIKKFSTPKTVIDLRVFIIYNKPRRVRCIFRGQRVDSPSAPAT